MFPDNIGYGFRRTAGWIINNENLTVTADNEMYAGEEIVATECDAKETIDDPKRGAKILENDWICSDNVSVNVSTVPQNSEVTEEKGDLEDTHTRHDPEKFIDTETILSYMKEYTEATKTRNHAEEQLVDGSNKEFNTVENNGTCTSDKSQRNMIYGNENRTYNSAASKTEEVEEEANISSDAQKR